MREYFKSKYYRQIAYLALWCYKQLDKRLGERRSHLEKAVMCAFAHHSESIADALEKQKKAFNPNWRNPC